MKCEELNKVSIDLQGERSRMQHENMEAVRKLNDYQKSIEMAGLDKNKVGDSDRWQMAYGRWVFIGIW